MPSNQKEEINRSEVFAAERGRVLVGCGKTIGLHSGALGDEISRSVNVGSGVPSSMLDTPDPFTIRRS